METFVIKKGGADYPKCLLDLPQPPQQLYCRGRKELLTRPAVAIVGTRDCTRYGVFVAKETARRCAESGITVISGGAAGIDTAGHMGALEVKGGAGTICVLGNGLNQCYPAENWGMQKQIEADGLVISEYPDDFPANKQTFPQRNRIVAALSRAVVVAEADYGSGTMITVKAAKKMNRQVFAVPGNINSYASNGANALIKNKTAEIMTGVDDILDFFRVKGTKEGGEKSVSVQISMDEKNILDILGRGEAEIDELTLRCGLPIHTLMTTLTNMELSGLIEKLPGNIIAAKSTMP
jgi:DNA processing protein